MKINNKQRNIENCFTVECDLPNFNTNNILKIINAKLKSGEKVDENLESLRKILENYNSIKNEEDSYINEENDYYNDIPGRRTELKNNYERFTKQSSKKIQRTKSFLLIEINSNNGINFLLEGSANKGDDEFKFYK